MNSRTRKLVVSATLAVSVLGAGTFAYASLGGTDPSASTSSTRVLTAALGTVSSTVGATGTLAPVTSLDLSFAGGGTLTAVNVKAGDTVKAGQVLARVDNAAATVALETAKADLLAAQAKLATAKAADPVDAVAVAQATAALHAAQLKVSDAQKALDATTLTAPMAGTITAINSAVGQNVSGTFATLVDTSKMVADVSWAEADAGQLAVGQTATVTLDSLGQTVPGRVTSIDTTATVVSDVVTYAGVVTLDQVPTGLRSGMSATVSVVTASRSGVVAVPSAAISTSGGTSTVTVSADGRTSVRTVTLGLKGDGTTEIASGLSPGEQVVIAVGTVSAPTSSSASSTRSNGSTGGLGIATGGGLDGPPPGAP